MKSSKMSLSKVVKRLGVGAIVGAIMSLPIALTGLYGSAVPICIAFLLFSALMEHNQGNGWRDTITNFVADNAGFNAAFWMVMYFGGYFA